MMIGRRIKELREKQNMTLTELSKQSGVQIATLSRMENLKMTGTIESHTRIAKALGVDLTQLYQNMTLQDTEQSQMEEKPVTESYAYNDKASYEILTTKILNKKMMPVILRIEPGGRTSPEQSPPGAERFIFILKGRITAHIGEKTFPLSANHTLYFDASEKHHFENAGKEIAKVVSVVTPVML